MSKTSKKISILVILVVVIAAAVILILPKITPDSTVADQKRSADAAHTSATPSPSTIATQWQWHQSEQEFKQSKKAADSDEQLPFTPKSVHDALQAVKVDEDGNIILDDDALIALDEALERIHNKLDSESLIVLQDLIKAALPGKAGEQTAKLVGDYDQFLQAKEEFSQVNENAGYTGAEPTVASVKSDQALYAELQALREVYLGKEVADSLFRLSDANAQFMFESMKLGLDESLTPQEREKIRQEIEARRIEQSQ